MLIQNITANVTGASKVKKLEGRDHLVVPVVMITNGVHIGSNGPIYYAGEEIAADPSMWDHMPIVVYHPDEGSARTAAILNSSKVGIILNAKVKITKDGITKLHAEAWIDIALANKVDKRVVEAIESDTIMEVSTGVYSTNVAQDGVWKDEAYEAIATDLRPDHLALLPDMEGACSVRDGAGLLQLNAAQLKRAATFKDDAQFSLIVNRAFRAAADVALDKMALTINKMSYSQISSAIGETLRDTLGKRDGTSYYWSGWVEDVYDDKFVYWNDGKLYQQTYVMDDASLTLVGDPTPVRRVTEYEKITINATPSLITNQKKDFAMDRAEQVTALITNKATGWTEAQREFLTKLDDAQFAPIYNTGKPAAPAPAPTPEPKPEPTTNAVKAQTWDELVKNADPATRDMMTEMASDREAKRDALVKEITGNSANVYTEAQLKAKDTQELRAIAALARNNKPAPDYSGAGGSHQDFVQNAGLGEPLSMPGFEVPAPSQN